jgi:hypothetical protein
MKKRGHGARRSVLLTATLLGLLVVLVPPPGRPPGPPARAVAAAAEEGEDRPASEPAARLRLRVGKYDGKPAGLQDAAATAWDKAAATRVLLNRTPRIYQTEEPARTRPPLLEVRALRCAGRLVLRLVWDDQIRDAPQAPPRKRGEGGTPARLYKRPTGETSTFPDAAAVMVPRHRLTSGFPSLVMGDRKGPVRLYYWNASRGAEELSATGRATVEGTGKAFPCQARHGGGKWSVTMDLPAAPAGFPVAFAVWDGHTKDRNGLKFFSVWYVLE